MFENMFSGFSISYSSGVNPDVVFCGTHKGFPISYPSWNKIQIECLRGSLKGFLLVIHQFSYHGFR